MSNCNIQVNPCSVPNEFDVGDLVQLDASFSTAGGGTPVDPDTVKLIVTAPSGGQTIVNKDDPNMLNPQLGLFTYNYDVVEPGRHHVRWESTGTGQAAQETYFGVRDPGPVDCPPPGEERGAAITKLMEGPKKVQGDEGSVEERSISEAIEADRYLGGRSTDPPLHGIRLARVKPNGTV